MTVTSATLSGPLLGQYLVYITPEFKNIIYKGKGYTYLLTETLTTIYYKTFCSRKTGKWSKGGVEPGALCMIEPGSTTLNGRVAFRQMAYSIDINK